MTKDKIIEKILKLTKASGERHFDKLMDMELSHLNKLLKACTLLNK